MFSGGLMNKTLLSIAAVLIVILGAFFLYSNNQKQGVAQPDYKNISYTIDGQQVQLTDGMAVTDTIPGAASKVTTTYFGNVAKGDLNGDGIPDLAFLLTQNSGGSGTFYYVVAALQNRDGGYVGTNAILLGDRIAPQTTEIQGGELIVNYADRKPGDPMSTQPSVGVSKYLTVSGYILVEGDSNTPAPTGKSGIRGTVLLGPTCPLERIPPDPKCADKLYQTNLELTTVDGTRVVATFASDSEGTFSVDVTPGAYTIRSVTETNVHPYCSTHEAIQVTANKYTNAEVSCDTGIR